MTVLQVKPAGVLKKIRVPASGLNAEFDFRPDAGKRWRILMMWTEHYGAGSRTVSYQCIDEADPTSLDDVSGIASLSAYNAIHFGAPSANSDNWHPFVWFNHSIYIHVVTNLLAGETCIGVAWVLEQDDAMSGEGIQWAGIVKKYRYSVTGAGSKTIDFRPPAGKKWIVCLMWMEHYAVAAKQVSFKLMDTAHLTEDDDFCGMGSLQPNHTAHIGCSNSDQDNYHGFVVASNSIYPRGYIINLLAGEQAIGVALVLEYNE